MIRLPIDASLPEIVQRVRQRRTLVLVAPPGAGKTTRVPTALVEAGLLSTGHPALVLLQPRRVAARAAATRIAHENGWVLGEEVGYQIRFEKRIGPRTRIRVVTEGILNRQLLSDPFLEGVGAVVLDEFHERSLHTDLAIALLREVRESVRDDLILVVMSATMEAGPVAEFLGGAPIIRVEGRSFPVEIRYQGSSKTPLADRVASAVEEAVDGASGAETGDVLAFLPGVEEIRRAGRQLAPWAARSGSDVLPLHGSLTTEEQDRALRPSDRRKVVLATNIAETSLTIDGIATVIDGGQARFASYDPARGLDRLELGRISKASAEQRAGRAGRTRPGRCLRLWSEREHRGLPDSEVPEVRRVDLCATLLALHAWGHSDPSRFGWYEAPEPTSMAAAEQLLVMLGALDGAGGTITSLGRKLLEVPAHPRLARLLLESARLGALHEGASLAALLSEKDILTRSFGRDVRPEIHAESDLLVRLDRLDEAERARFAPGLRDRGIDPAAARQVAKVRDDLLRVARKRPGGSGPRPDQADETTLLKLILLAYPDRVARRRASDGSTGVMVGGRGIRLDPESVVRDAEFFLALDPREDRRGGTLEARVRIASALRPEWLEELFPGSVRRERTVQFVDDRRRVVGVSTVSYRDLTLREDRNIPVEPEAAARALAQALAPRARSIFEGDEASALWLARLDLARLRMPEAGWPEFHEMDWAELIAMAAEGRRSEEEILRGPMLSMLKSRLSFAENRRLDEQIPESLLVPSGSRVRLSYPKEGPPILAVRLQELFGWTETPRIAGGRVPVVLHLLGPNYRPVQITDDLRSFWAIAYFQVRKDLRARYPKHSWPDDPLTARAEARGGRRPG
jgi:ATP-dependent RNA helicase HrpB